MNKNQFAFRSSFTKKLTEFKPNLDKSNSNRRLTLNTREYSPINNDQSLSPALHTKLAKFKIDPNSSQKSQLKLKPCISLVKKNRTIRAIIGVQQFRLTGCKVKDMSLYSDLNLNSLNFKSQEQLKKSPKKNEPINRTEIVKKYLRRKNYFTKICRKTDKNRGKIDSEAQTISLKVKEVNFRSHKTLPSIDSSINGWEAD